RNTRRLVLALVLLVLALVVGVTWSLGLFSSSSANPDNVISSGSMHQTNSADDQAIMSAADLVPGQSVEGTATIRNEGGGSGAFALKVVHLADSPGPAGGRLSDALRVQVVQRGVGSPVYDGPLRGLQAGLGTWPPNQERTYDFTVSLPGRGA